MSWGEVLATEQNNVQYACAQSCLTLCGPIDSNPSDSSVYGISQARRLEWVATSYSRESARPRDQTTPLCLLHWQSNSSPLAPIAKSIQYNSVWFSCPVLSNYFWLHGLQHARLLCPSSTPRVSSNLCPSSPPTILSSVVHLSSCLQSFPATRSFPMSQFFKSGGQTGASASASVLPMNIQDWLPWGLSGLTSLLSKWFSTIFCNTTVQKHQFLGTQPSLWSNSHIHTWLLEKP